MVLKAPEAGPAPIFEFARMVDQAGFPPGVVNVVTGFGEPRGRALTSHPRVAPMAFTGGPYTARQVVRNAAENFAVTSLERGGKSPFIVFGAPQPATSAARGAAPAQRHHLDHHLGRPDGESLRHALAPAGVSC